MNRYLAGVLALITAMMIAGCGSGGESSSDAGAMISKAEYVKQADAICGQTEKQQLQLIGGFGKTKPTRQGRIELIEYAGIPPLEQQEKGLIELPAPREEAAAAKAYLAAYSAGVKQSKEDPEALLEGPSPFAKAETLAKKFGFKVCGGA